MDAGAGKAYVKAGYSEGSIGTIQSRHESTVNSQSDSLEGPMIGIGFETDRIGIYFKFSHGKVSKTHNTIQTIWIE